MIYPDHFERKIGFAEVLDAAGSVLQIVEKYEVRIARDLAACAQEERCCV